MSVNGIRQECVASDERKGAHLIKIEIKLCFDSIQTLSSV